MVITEKCRCEEDSPSETHLNGSIHDFAFGMAFFLCKGSHEGEHHFAFGVKGIQPFRLKKDTDRMRKGEQFTDVSYAVHDISGKTGYALGNDEVDFPFLAVLDHQFKLVTVLQGSAGDTFIRIDLYEFPVRTFADDIVVMVFL